MWVHNIDPVALDLGFLQIHWYGLMYLIGFAGALLLGNYRADQPGSGWSREQVSDFIFWGAMGVVLGGRFGYVLFYNFDRFLESPLWLFKVWEGGMSFHGGMLGVLVALWAFGKKNNKSLANMGDFVMPLVAIGLGAGRIGNFIGGELWGRTTDVSWAVVFPKAGPELLARHPSQLYEALLEGLVMFVILWVYSSKQRPAFAVSALFLFLYGLFRTGVEFFREPDDSIFAAFGWITKGQILSLPMILIGAALFTYVYYKANLAKTGEK